MSYSKYNILENDDFNLLVEVIINSNKGLLIQAPAGAGKTYLEKLLIEKLSCKYEKGQILKLAPTNCAVLEVGEADGKTLAKFSNYALKKQDWSYVKYIFCDEISMMSEIFYHLLLSIKKKNPDIKFILIGEFYQLPAVKDKINKLNNTDIYRKSDCLKQLVDNQYLYLTKCRRADSTLFNICNDVKHNKEIDITPFQQSKYLTWKNICYTNTKRIEINDKINKIFLAQKKPNKTFEVKKIDYDKNSQDFILAVNTPLISRVTNVNFKLFNNEQFVVQDIKDDVIVVKNNRSSDLIEIPKSRFRFLFYLNWCSTTHKTQGKTITENYTIHEFDKMNNTLRYVALSRGTKIEQITIENNF